jgi:hypothetical protein
MLAVMSPRCLPRRTRRLGLLAATAALTLGAAAAADAATTSSTSSNWAGYSVMRSGVKFKRVSAAWIVPTVTCADARQEWSAAWVGLGGYRATSTALEQIGTEADCSSSGKASYTSWYELVPAASHSAKLKVHPGDAMTASVTVSGHKVRLRMADDTTKKVFSKTLTASSVDVSSAEWIVEAPSACGGPSGSFCQVMPLADFATTQMSHARAQTTGGHSGTIADTAWDAVQIVLTPDTRRFEGPGGPPSATAGTTSAGASAGTLGTTGDAFTVTWNSTS